jgi:hypothetical protein
MKLHLKNCEKMLSQTSISRNDIHKCLDWLIEIEPSPLDMRPYDELMKPYSDQIKIVIEIIRKYGALIQPQTLKALQDTFYSFSNDRKYLADPIHTSVVRAYMKQAFEGINGWRN